MASLPPPPAHYTTNNGIPVVPGSTNSGANSRLPPLPPPPLVTNMPQLPTAQPTQPRMPAPPPPLPLSAGRTGVGKTFMDEDDDQDDDDGEDGAEDDEAMHEIETRAKMLVLDVSKGKSKAPPVVPLNHEKLDLTSLPPPPFELISPSARTSSSDNQALRKTPPLEVFPPLPPPPVGELGAGAMPGPNTGTSLTLTQSRRRVGGGGGLAGTGKVVGSAPLQMRSSSPLPLNSRMSPPPDGTSGNLSVATSATAASAGNSRPRSGTLPSQPTLSPSSNDGTKTFDELPSATSSQPTENLSRKSSPGSPVYTSTSPNASSSEPTSSTAGASMAGVWTESLKRRSTVSRNTSKHRAELKRTSTYSGRTASLALRGTVFDLSTSPFRDFPELRFKEFPTSNVDLDKDLLKPYLKLKEQLLKDREKQISDRDALLQMQQKREEQIMKDFQAEMNRRAQQRLKEFQRRSKTSLRGSMNKASAAEIKQESEEFERTLFDDLQRSQQELEQRLLHNRLRWIMPWFQNMKAMEMLQYTQVHQLEWTSLEEMQLRERQQFEESQEQIISLDLKGFDKQLKMTMRERKKAQRPMTKEEAEWEREIFLQNEADRVRNQLAALEEDQRRIRGALEQKQQRQLTSLETYYNQLERLLLSPPGNPTEPIHHTSASSYFRSSSMDRESPTETRAQPLKKYGTMRG